MKKSNLSWILLPILIFLFVFLSFGSFTKVSAAATHIVISQIQVSGTIAADEFVELYNPTDSDINLSKWKLIKENSTNTLSQNLVSSMSGTIKSHGYFLVTSQVSAASSTADLLYSTASITITDNNTVVLVNSAGTQIDKVGMGTAADQENSNALLPPAGKSIERKIDDTGGHGQDTDNNANDFALLNASNPRNASIIITPTLTPSPTITPIPTETPTPTIIPTETQTPTPTMTPTPTENLTPTLTPTPTDEPSPTPTNEPTPTNTPSPTLTPTLTPTPTNTPTPTLTLTPTITQAPSPTSTPSATLTPTQVPSVTTTPTQHNNGHHFFPNYHLHFKHEHIDIKIYNHKLRIPFITCSISRR
jgi:hypothetical protein